MTEEKMQLVELTCQAAANLLDARCQLQQNEDPTQVAARWREVAQAMADLAGALSATESVMQQGQDPAGAWN